MKHKFSPLILASISAGMISLAATPSSIAADLIISNKTDITSCKYSSAVFGQDGKLTLTLANPSCLITGGDGGNGGNTGGSEGEDGGNTGGSEGEDGGNTGGSEGEDGGNTGGGEENPACGPVDSSVSVINHNWTTSLDINARAPILLPKNNTYSLKLTGVSDKGGYGSTNTHVGVGNVATRKMVISECPGSMIPAAGNQTTATGYNPCVSIGAAGTALKWSHDSSTPTSPTYCRLEPSKQYYINIKNETDAKGDSTCKAASCMFLLDYTFSRKH